MSKAKVLLCSEDKTVEIGYADVELTSEPKDLLETWPSGATIRPYDRHNEVILRNVDFIEDAIAEASQRALQGDIEFYQDQLDRSRNREGQLKTAVEFWFRECDRASGLLEEESENHEKRVSQLQATIASANERLTRQQQNFEEYTAGQERARDIRKEGERAIKANGQLARDNLSLREQASATHERIAQLEADAEFWHQQYIESEAALGDYREMETITALGDESLRDSWRRVNEQRISFAAANTRLREENQRLVDELNSVADIINTAAERTEAAA